MTTHIDHGEALAAAERLALEVLRELSPGCAYARALSGSTMRGPAFLYACGHCAALSIVSVPAGGLRARDPGDPTSRTRIATYPLASVVVETGAYIESDGTIRALLALHLPGSPEPAWEITTDRADAVGEAVVLLRGLAGPVR
ncbi:MAG TPA: hypothetical protein VI248_22210 [Kineosporiaceae bacterium]